jgi:hypothetical protein
MMTQKQIKKVQDIGCGGEWSETDNGPEFDCEHQYDWTCDHCPCNMETVKASKDTL